MTFHNLVLFHVFAQNGQHTIIRMYFQCHSLFLSYESFNSIMRAQSIFSNHHSPSRDITTNFAIMAHLKYICAGGNVPGLR